MVVTLVSVREVRRPFNAHDVMGCSAESDPTLSIVVKPEPQPHPEPETPTQSKPEQPPNIELGSPRNLIPTTIFRNVGDLFDSFQIPIWSAWQPNVVILYRPKKTDTLSKIRNLLQFIGGWYPGDHKVKCITPASSQIKELKDWTSDSQVPVVILLLPKSNIYVNIDVKQRNRYMDINYIRTLTIDICITDTVLELKKKIRTMAGFPLDQQDLLLNDRVMLNDRALYDYEIRDKTTIKLILIPKNTFKIRVAAFWNKAYNLEVDRCSVIQDVVIGVLWNCFMERNSHQAKYVIGCLLQNGLLSLQYNDKRLELDRCLEYYSIPMGSKLKLRARYSGSQQDRSVTILCDRNETIQVQCSGNDNWAMIGLKSLAMLNLPLDKMTFANDDQKLNFIDAVCGKPGDNFKIKLTLENMSEIKIWQHQTIQVKLPQGSVQLYHFTQTDTVRDMKLYIEQTGFRLATCYHMMVGDVHLNNHMLLSELPFAADDVITLSPDDFAIYLHLKGLQFAFLREQGLQTMEGLQKRYISLTRSALTSSLIFSGQLVDNDDTYMYETFIGPNCAIFLEDQPEIIVLKLRTESDPHSISMRCVVPTNPKRNAQIVADSQHLWPKTSGVFEQFLNWRLAGYKKANGNAHIMRNSEKENVQAPGMKPILHGLVDDFRNSYDSASKFKLPETMPGHLIEGKDIPDSMHMQKLRNGRRRSAPEARKSAGGDGESIPGLRRNRDIRDADRHRRNQGTREDDFRLLTPTFRRVEIGLPRLARFANRERLVLSNKKKFAVNNWKPARYVVGTLRKQRSPYSSLPDIKTSKMTLVDETGVESPEMVDACVQADISELDEEDMRRYRVIIPSNEPDMATQAWAKKIAKQIADTKKQEEAAKSDAGTNITGKKSGFSLLNFLRRKKKEPDEDITATPSREESPEPPPRTPKLGEETMVKGRRVKLQATMTDVRLFIDEEWPSRNAVVNATNPKDILKLQRIAPLDPVEEDKRAPVDRMRADERNDARFITYDGEVKVKIVNYFDDPIWDEAQTKSPVKVEPALAKLIVEEMRENLNIQKAIDILQDQTDVKKVKREKVRYQLINQGANTQPPVKFTQADKLNLDEDLLPVIADEDAGLPSPLENIAEAEERPVVPDVDEDAEKTQPKPTSAVYKGSKKVPVTRTSATKAKRDESSSRTTPKPLGTGDVPKASPKPVKKRTKTVAKDTRPPWSGYFTKAVSPASGSQSKTQKKISPRPSESTKTTPRRSSSTTSRPPAEAQGGQAAPSKTKPTKGTVTPARTSQDKSPVRRTTAKQPTVPKSSSKGKSSDVKGPSARARTKKETPTTSK